MKKILEILMLIMIIVLTGCNHNKSLFETRRKSRNIILDSKNSKDKASKDREISTITNLNGDNIIISEYKHKESRRSRNEKNIRNINVNNGNSINRM